MAEYGKRCITDVMFPLHRDFMPPRSTIFDIPPFILMENLGRSDLVVTMEWTWNKIVNRLNGAVTVLATEPASPPQKSCFAASTVLVFTIFGSASFPFPIVEVEIPNYCCSFKVGFGVALAVWIY